MANELRICKLIKNSGSSVLPFEGTKIYISTGDIEDIDCLETVTFKDKPSRANLEVKYTDILVAKMKNTNKTTKIDNILSNNIYSTGFFAFNSDILNNNYLFYLLSCDEFISEKDSYCLGTTQMSINENGIKKIIIHYVDKKDKQQQIADYLNKKTKEIDAIITQTISSIEEYKKYKQAVITEAVTKGLNPKVELKDSGIEWIGEIPKDWEIKSFKAVIGYCVDNRGKTPPLSENGIPMLEIDSLTNKYPDISKIKKFISQETYDNFLRKYLKTGDILFATVGSIGKTSIIPDKFNYCIAQNIVGFRPNKNQNNLYWFYYINSEAFRLTYLQFNKENILGSIKISNLMNGTVVVPFIQEQQQIADYLDKKTKEIDAIISQKEQLISELEIYKKSLIYEFVTGKKEIV